MTRIEWVKSQDGSQGRTWNPVTGCTKISPGCKNCYAERMARRQVAMGFARHERGSDNDDTWIAYSNAIDPDTGRWSGEITCRYKELDAPLKRKKPTTYFVCSMSDLFHEDVPFTFISEIWLIAAACPQHTFQILTKRPRRMLEYVTELHKQTMAAQPLPNVWLGVSCENQAAADERIPLLLQTPATVRFVSAEPLLGAMDLTSWLSLDQWLVNPLNQGPAPETLDWAIVGGESGPGARPMHPDWARDIRDQCQAAGVPYFFKAWGACMPFKGAGASVRWDDGTTMLRVGKKAAGRQLDGREWNEMPGREI